MSKFFSTNHAMAYRSHAKLYVGFYAKFWKRVGHRERSEH